MHISSFFYLKALIHDMLGSNMVDSGGVRFTVLPSKEVLSYVLHDIERATYKQNFFALAALITLSFLRLGDVVQSLDEVTTFD